MFAKSVLAMSLLSMAHACEESVKAKLKEDLENPCLRRVTMYVTYTKRVECDEKKSRLDLVTQPAIRLMYAHTDKTYILLMLSPDSPGSSIDSLTFYLQWAATSVEGIYLLVGPSIPKGPILYERPMATGNSPIRRYQFIVFEEPKTGNVKLPSNNRNGFKLWDYMTDNKLCSSASIFQFKVPSYM